MMQGIGAFRSGGTRPSVQAVIPFIDERRAVHEAAPICEVLPITRRPTTPSAVRQTDPSEVPARLRSNARLSLASGEAGMRTSGSTEGRSGGRCGGATLNADRCTAARWMRHMGLNGATRGKAVRTTISGRAAPDGEPPVPDTLPECSVNG